MSSSEEQAEQFRFLQGHLPFAELALEDLLQVVRALEVRSGERGARLFGVGDRVTHLLVVRKGAVELLDERGALVSREGEGECLGFPALLTGGTAQREARFIEDGVVFRVPEGLFHELRHRCPAFDRFFAAAHEDRLRTVVDDLQGPGRSLLAQPVRAVVRREPVFVEPTVTVQVAAQRMAEEGIASILIGRAEGLLGILTDRDLRGRVVARGLDASTPVRAVMTENPHRLDAQARCLEALLAMTRHRVHHLPVVEAGRVIGVVSATDLLRVQAAHPVYLVSEIQRQVDVAGLASAAARLPGVVQRLAEADLRAAEVMRVVTFVADALTERLIQLAEVELGPAPAPFAWVGLGSQARGELGVNSDQDNALVLSPGAEVHDAWFARMARFVTEGLAACGFPPCPGDVMATTWRKSSTAWLQGFEHWIDTPDPKALLNAGVFFDMRVVHGATGLVDDLRGPVLEQAKKSQRFLAALARAALEHRPPIGFFRQFVLDRGGAEGKALDLKHRGLKPIVSLARVYALSVGSAEVETRRRVEDAAKLGGLAPSDAASLLDAHAYVAQVRLRHQAKQMAAGGKPDNYVSPDALSGFERAHLKDAFRVVEGLQSGLEYRFKTGMLG